MSVYLLGGIFPPSSNYSCVVCIVAVTSIDEWVEALGWVGLILL